jgi:hypothetical protein
MPKVAAYGRSISDGLSYLAFLTKNGSHNAGMCVSCADADGIFFIGYRLWHFPLIGMPILITKGYPSVMYCFLEKISC